MPPLNIAVVGPGAVGSEFIRQLSLSPHLFSIVAISNSRSMLLSQTALSPNDWPKLLASASLKPDLAALASHAASLRPCVIVDCTSSEAVASNYPSWLRSGLNVVTPNKKAFSGTQELWDDLKQAAKEGRVDVYHESTVGAGLPILSTLKDLVETKDEIVRIEGVLSGTLSYVFNNFSTLSKSESAPSFSSIVTVAKENGFTEPDPRDDLNGMDVARKVVILGRAAGLKLDISTLHKENIVPESLRGAASAAAFMEELSKTDAHFAKLNNEALDEGCVLRYVGVIDPKGESSVKLGKYPASHPFASLTGSDNVVAFTTKIFPSPLIIQGAGAGAAVTAFGMVSDVLKIARKASLC
ncbi:hypothetical protein HKX48_005589 [Thoreauomyces humboldtii]|nr:hypothetical protein HKX48_005589 [Thoreauomyces humboldtii]